MNLRVQEGSGCERVRRRAAAHAGWCFMGCATCGHRTGGEAYLHKTVRDDEGQTTMLFPLSAVKLLGHGELLVADGGMVERDREVQNFLSLLLLQSVPKSRATAAPCKAFWCRENASISGPSRPGKDGS